MALLSSVLIGKTQNSLQHGPSKLQKAVKEIQSIGIFIVRKEYHKTLTKKSLY